MGNYSLTFYVLFIGTFTQIAVGHLINDFQMMDELTANLISEEIGDNGSGEEIVPFPNPGETEAFDAKTNDETVGSEYNESFSYNEDESTEESLSNFTKNEQEITITVTSRNNDSDNDIELEDNFNVTETDKDNLYIEGSWIEFDEYGNNELEPTEQEEAKGKTNEELMPENEDQYGEDLNIASFGMGIFKENREFLKDIPNPIVEIPKAVRNTIVELPNNVRNSIAKLPDTVRNSAGNIWNGVKQVPKKVMNIPNHLPRYFNRSPAPTTQTSNPSRKYGFLRMG